MSARHLRNDNLALFDNNQPLLPDNPALSIGIGFLANGLLGADGHLTEVVVGTIVDIEVYITLDTWQAACVGVLPELPRAFVLQGVHIIVGYPVGILVKDGIVQIARLEFKVGVDDRFHLIVFLHDVEPLQHTGLELIIGLILRFVLHVEHRGQVAIL